MSAETILARDRAADFATWPNREWPGARAALAPLVEREDAAVEDLLRAACVELSDKESGSLEAAMRFVGRAEKLEPENHVLLWCKARIARDAYENVDALEVLRELRALRPDDFLVELLIASIESDLGETAAAEKGFGAVLDIAPKFTADWRVFALYRMRGLLIQDGRMEEAMPFIAEYQEFDERGVKSPGEPAFQAGTLGEIPPATLSPFRIVTPVASATYTGREIAAGASIRGARVVRFTRGKWTSDVGRERLEPDEEQWAWTPDSLRLLAWGADGLFVLERDASGTWTRAATLLEENVFDVVPFDRKNHGQIREEKEKERAGDRDLDLLVLIENEGRNELRLFENVKGVWSLHDEPLVVTSTTAAGRIMPIDFDHDGDADVLASFDDGIRVLRNDGYAFDEAEAAALTARLREEDEAAEPVLTGTMTDVSGSVPFPAGAFDVVSEDVDGDQDVDLVLVGRGGESVRLLDDRRAGEFVDATASLPSMTGDHIAVADFDGSSWTDFAVFSGATVTMHRQSIAGVWTDPLIWKLDAAPTGAPVAIDVDLDGTTDLVWPADDVGVAGLLAPGFSNGGVPFDLGRAFEGSAPIGAASVRAVDLDDDRDIDFLHVGANGVRELLADGSGRGLRMGLMGYKNNSYGIGAIVEMRSGRKYRRVFWRGSDQLLGFGAADRVDFVRITWPNGVTQAHFDLPVDSDIDIWGRPGQAGSCPFLYTWNGETYEYISDVLGITPLGLPMAPGMIVAPDHDEYVLVHGEQLVPKDGVYEIVITEELREVTYLDRVRLDVIDHPQGTEIFPNERFCFPPFPEAHVHTVRDALVPLSVTDGEGRDWTGELAANDDVLAAPFEALYGQFQGLATPHTLELAFDAERVASAKKLRLLLNGWLFWTDASVNMAAARHPAHSFVPPILQVPDNDGGWRDTGPPIGFPAGKLKTMVVDVTELLNREDPRIRLFSTLRLYWDSIRLAVDADDTPFVTTELDPESAELWDRGFSAPILKHGDFALEWFDWDHVADLPRWNQHPGMYTRFGETVPLVTEIDDLFCVMGAGDALTVRFDATKVPPLRAGWRRDYLVFFDGWAKDRDPNTLGALYVEPLPFHGMSGYPYGEDEAFPDDAEHLAWRREWQTRPAQQHIEPLVSRAAWAYDDPTTASAGRAIDASYHKPDPRE